MKFLKWFRGFHCPQSSFLEGFSRVLDLTGGLSKLNLNFDRKKADKEAIKSDWKNIGQDLYKSINKFQTIVRKDRERNPPSV